MVDDKASLVSVQPVVLWRERFHGSGRAGSVCGLARIVEAVGAVLEQADPLGAADLRHFARDFG
jgi:hypothetical protein